MPSRPPHAALSSGDIKVISTPAFSGRHTSEDSVEDPDLQLVRTQSSKYDKLDAKSIALLKELPKSTSKSDNGVLTYLKETEYMFFKRCKKLPPEIRSFVAKNKTEVWNKSGHCIYYLGTTDTYTCCTKFCKSGFSVSVVDNVGRPFLFVKGEQTFTGMNASSVISFKEPENILGKVKLTSCYSTAYDVFNSNGRHLFRIQGPCFGPYAPWVFWCCDEHFEICLTDGVTEIGRITKFWDPRKLEDEAVHKFRHNLGIRLLPSMDPMMKALLLGTFFLIDFQYYRNGGNGWFFFIISALVVLLFIGWWTSCFGWCPGGPFVYFSGYNETTTAKSITYL